MVYADRRGLFMNGKAEAASGAPTCEKRVNTFSFCGTGGSFFILIDFFIKNNKNSLPIA